MLPWQDEGTNEKNRAIEMNNSLPVEVHYPPSGRARYAVVLGSGGEVWGVAKW